MIEAKECQVTSMYCMEEDGIDGWYDKALDLLFISCLKPIVLYIVSLTKIHIFA